MARDRFDHSVDHSDVTKPAAVRRVEVNTGVERRRRWSTEEKLAIVAESLAEGAVVSEVARRHGLSPQQPFGWRAKGPGRDRRGEDRRDIRADGFAFIGLRPNVAYGYGRAAGETAAITEAIRAAAKGQAYIMSYASSMCFQYVEEVVGVMLRCLTMRPEQLVFSDITTTPETIEDVIAAIKCVAPIARLGASEKMPLPPTYH